MAKAVRVAAAQPRSHWGEEEWRTAWQCLELIDKAASQGAQLVLFPEAYPGRGHGPLDSGRKLPLPPMEMVRDRAARRRVYVTASCLEPVPGHADLYWLTLTLIGPDGEVVATYRRCHLDTHYLHEYLHGGRRHILPGDEIVVVPRGAEIILAPVNGQHSETKPHLADTWRWIARARASENLCYVLVTQNLFRDGVQEVGIIAGPERALATADGPALPASDLDMDRLAYVRTSHDARRHFMPPTEDEPAIGCRPGQIHERRPELFGLLALPQEDAFDCMSSLKGPEAVQREHQRVREYCRPGVATGELVVR